MAKQLNQRYCYRLNSNYIERNKGKIKITNIGEAIKQRYIVGIGDSDATRTIRNIIHSKYTELYIDNKKEYLKFLRKKYNHDKTDKNIKREIKNIINDIRTASLQDFICNVEFNTNKAYDKYAESGFILNGHKYELLLGTPNGIKKQVVLFIRSDLRLQVEEILNCGADFDAKVLNKNTNELETIKVVPNKIMSYKALMFSSSIPVKWTRNILVVKDVETSFTSDVLEVKMNKETNEPDVFPVFNKLITLNATDGGGLITPELAKIWSEMLELDFVTSGFCVRNAWTKGMLTCFDFKKYCKEILHVTRVKDVFGEWQDIDDIDIILNESMLKLNYPYYKSISEYCDNCEKYGFEFAVTKFIPKTEDNERMLNYQYLQCLDLSDEKIDELLDGNIKEIIDVIGADPIKSILFGKGKDLTDKNVWLNGDINDYHIKALMVDPNAIQDEFITNKIKKAISKRINMMKTGKIKVKGNYQIAVPEPIIQLEHMCGFEPKGLLKANEFFIKYWLDLGIEKVAGFRSPMSCKQNARVMNVCNNEEAVKWYGHIKNMIIFNAWDTSMMAFNGEDFDGDQNFTTSNEIIVNSIYDLPTLDCDSESAIKISNPTREDYIKAIKNSFGNKVGSVTNTGSGFYDKLSLFKKDNAEYKELDRRIQCIQYIQQSCIDSAKQGKPPEPIPAHWYNNKCEAIKIKSARPMDADGKFTGDIELILDDDETIKHKQYLESMCAYKKPYYFRYIYDESNIQYLAYQKEVNILCIREFNMTLNNLINKKNKSAKEEYMLKYYLEKNPLSDNNCIVNKIAHKVENALDDISKLKSQKNKNFDYSIYAKDVLTKVDAIIISKIKKIFSDYKKMITNKKNNIEKIENEDILNNCNQTMDIIIDELLDAINNKYELTDVLLYLSYKKSVLTKSFVWTAMGDVILDNMLNKFNRTICYPARCSDGDILYDGEYFILKTKMINERS